MSANARVVLLVEGDLTQLYTQWVTYRTNKKIDYHISSKIRRAFRRLVPFFLKNF
jgi:hypothetical protein